jgi:ATP-dependent Lon protease
MEQIPSALPVLPIRTSVVFPSISVPLVVGRGNSLRALDQADGSNGLIVVVTQKTITPGDPLPDDLFRVGTLCKIESTVSTENGSRQIVVTGTSRYRIAEFELLPEGYISARGETVADVQGPDLIRNEALLNNLKEASREILELLPGPTDHLMWLMERVDDPSYLSNLCAAYLNLSLYEKQDLLETVQTERRMEKILAYMRKEREVLSVQKDIRDKMSERLSKAQREALLREQLRTIRQELGEDASEDTADQLEEKIRQARLPEDAAKQAADEMRRLRALPVNSAEYHVIRTYLEWLVVLPWNKRTVSQIDLEKARRTLDEDHFGLENVKKRIIQFLAVAKLKKDLRGPILCLVGPPGVGKTSLGQSIARALDRKFIRTSLGGVRDEAEIRGHRRTYVGAMPGRIIQSIKRCGSKNPVMILDEIDKLRADFHGDPSAAMLEVLDPEQNRTFTDHYLDLPFDLSEVFFICTANVMDTIPAPLRDRMEVIEVNGYTLIEKLHIARQYLVPDLIQEHGLKQEWIDLPDESIQKIIVHHTREAGVRELKRKIAALFRAAAEEVVDHMRKSGAPVPILRLTPEWVQTLLGPDRFLPEAAERALKSGVVMALAWTPHGGDLLFIEAATFAFGKGNLILTGQLGDVMKESAQIALSLARSTADRYGYKNFNFSENDIHIHVPAGAIPKDGPSAGVAIYVALVSLLLAKPIRSGLAMTGEVTLRGAVMPVGGIKEKVLAGHRAQLDMIILPRKNEQDLRDVPEEIRSQLKVVLIDNVEEALMHALGLSVQRIPPSPPMQPSQEKAA